MKKTILENSSQTKSHSQLKDEQISSVLTTIKTNPKFIKLLCYSLNTLEGFLTPPNKEIKINSRIIINLQGLEILKSVGMVNISNEEVLKVFS